MATVVMIGMLLLMISISIVIYIGWLSIQYFKSTNKPNLWRLIKFIENY